MGRLIDADKLLEKQYRIDDSVTLSSRDVVNVEDIEDASPVEAISKAEYEARLKAAMVVILTGIQLEIEELKNPYQRDYDDSIQLAGYNAFYEAKSEIDDLIEEKINSLMEQEDGNVD